MKGNFKAWLRAASVRALRTIAQTALALIPVSVTVAEIDWLTVGGTALLAGILSLLTSVAGLPEIEEASGND